MIKKSFSSIKTSLLMGLFLGTLASIFIAGFYSIYINKIEFYEKFEKHRNDVISIIATNMSKPVYEFSPNSGSLVLSSIKHEEFIVSIDIYDSINEIQFLSFHVPQRDKGTIYKNRKDIIKDDNVIGQIEISFSDFKLQEELKNTRSFLVKIFTITFCALIVIMYPILHKKIFKPLKKLHNQIDDMKNNNLEKRYVWDSSDEINRIGKSFDNARHTIVELIDKLTVKNKELEKLYITDRLTGLYNRYKIDMAMENEKKEPIDTKAFLELYF